MAGYSQPDLPLVRLLKEKGMSSLELAQAAGFSLRTIENWTSRARRPTPAQRARLARALGDDIHPDDLIDPNPRPYQRPTNPTRRPMGTGGTMMAVDDAVALWGKAQS